MIRKKSSINFKTLPYLAALFSIFSFPTIGFCDHYGFGSSFGAFYLFSVPVTILSLSTLTTVIASIFYYFTTSENAGLVGSISSFGGAISWFLTLVVFILTKGEFFKLVIGLLAVSGLLLAISFKILFKPKTLADPIIPQKTDL